jgi:predicted enzyme related to lactoylglutathione lyase
MRVKDKTYDRGNTQRRSNTMLHQQDRIDYVEFSATDIPATQTFYAAVFGWKFTDYGPDYVGFEDGNLGGGFAKVESNTTGGPLVILYSAALEKTRGDVIAKGGRIAKEIFAFPGGRRFHFLDPNGNELAVWSDKQGAA